MVILNKLVVVVVVEFPGVPRRGRGCPLSLSELVSLRGRLRTRSREQPHSQASLCCPLPPRNPGSEKRIDCEWF